MDLMPFPGPYNPRSLFELFTFYSEAGGIEDLLSEIDFAGMSIREIYHSVLGRRPESIKAAQTPAKFNARDHFRGALKSPEFQARALRLLLDAYPDKKRLLFVHVPKCAGTDLRVSLSARYPSFNTGLIDPHWATHDQLFLAIHRLVTRLMFSDTLLVYGHIRLSTAVDDAIVRPWDNVVTVIREPTEIVISAINYVVTRIIRDQTSGTYAADTRGWLRQLGFDRLSLDLSTNDIHYLFKTMLRTQGIVSKNTICYWLGNGDFKTFVNSVITNNVEITDTKRYSAWLRERWGITRTARSNESVKYVTEDILDQDDRDYIKDLTAEDRAAHALIVKALDHRGSTSVFGSEIDYDPVTRD
jgi:hypothetical protein